MSGLELTPEEKQRWIKHRTNYCHGMPSLIDTNPKLCEKAVKLYRSGISKNSVCKELHIAPDTLNKIVRAKGGITC